MHVDLDPRLAHFSSANSQEGPMATISCQCGQVRIQFPTHTPRGIQQCCCNECHARMAYLVTLGGPSQSDDVAGRKKPATFYYFVDRMDVKSGKDKLMFYQLKEGSFNYNMASSCCHTFFCGHSPAFSGNTVGVPADLGMVQNVDASDMKPLLRWFPKDMPAETNVMDEGSMPKGWVEDGKPTGTDGFDEAFGEIAKVWSDPVPESEDVGEKFIELLEAYKKNGGKVEFVNKD